MKKISALLIALCLFAAINLKAQVNKQDSLVLVSLYDSTGGTHWFYHTNWLTKAPVSTWYGIGLDANNRVDSIKLVGVSLTGGIPSFLGNLTDLTYLNLASNKLTGGIPSSLANLTSLTSLNLADNELTGNIPSNLVNLINLTYLNLVSNNLTGAIPSELGNLTNLTFLDLAVNKLSDSIPSSLGNLTKLTELVLDANQLSGPIPSSLSNLTNLQELYLMENQLSGTIPPWLGNLTNLSILELYKNQLTGTIPSSLGNLTNLTFFLLENNQLSGPIPSSILNLTKLSPTGEGGVSNNKFTFAGMEGIAKLSAYNDLYAPQAIVPLQQNNTDTTLFVSVGGTLANDTYKWYNSGTLVATKKSDSTYRPTSNGLYYVAATNAVATQLTLYSDTININYPTNTQDSLALVALYNSTGGANWVNHTNWLSKLPVSSWYGVTEYNWRVTGIALDSNNLKGAIPASVDSLPYLSVLKLSNNQLNFSSLEGVAKQYSFALYSPQASVPLQQIGSTLSVSVGGTPANDTFRWYKDSVLVATKVADSTYTFTSNGKYWVVATNSVATQLTLYSDTITITDLPIRDIALSAKETNGQVLLQWQTIGEQNTASFTIQRSTNGSSFKDIGTVKAVGSGANSYSFIDNNPANGINYYRLKSVDKDGASSYSNVAALTTNHLSLITIYPNPAKDVLTIGGIEIGKSYTATIVSVPSKQVSTSLIVGGTGAGVNVKNLSAGVYLLELVGKDGEKQTVRFVKE